MISWKDVIATNESAMQYFKMLIICFHCTLLDCVSTFNSNITLHCNHIKNKSAQIYLFQSIYLIAVIPYTQINKIQYLHSKNWGQVSHQKNLWYKEHCAKIISPFVRGVDHPPRYLNFPYKNIIEYCTHEKERKRGVCLPSPSALYIIRAHCDSDQIPTTWLFPQGGWRFTSARAGTPAHAWVPACDMRTW
jgi:hypothetical protein